jgi:two-component system chemotaxis response regulator CheB
MNDRKKVLIVDDSAVVRRVLSNIISSDPGLEVMATASDPFVAAEKIAHEKPDVMTLDIEMPRMDGLTFLQKIMEQHPIPVVIISSLAGSGTETAMKALESGAVDIIEKPQLGTKEYLEDASVFICDAVKAASQAKPSHVRAPLPISSKLSADAVIQKSGAKAMLKTTEKVIVVGASTGGTEAIAEFLTSMPMDSPGIVIVQHMPEKFTAAFSKRLDSICAISVKEAEDNDTVIRGRALIAPGNKHMLLKRSGARYYVEVKDGPLVSRHRPSVDVLFRSAASYAGKNAVGVIMTGMGDDGAQGMKEMKDAGSFNIAQDEHSCVVYGMPKEAVKAGGVDVSLPLRSIAGKVLAEC